MWKSAESQSGRRAVEKLEERRLFSALFGPVTKFPTGGSGASAMVTADFNGDGRPDVAITNFTDGTVSVLLNDGGGKFTALKPYAAGADISGLAVGDFNGDKKPDLAIIGDDLAIALGTGGGKFSTPVHYPAGIVPQAVVVSDFNGDKKQDLAVTDVLGDAVLIFKGTGTGTFNKPTTITGIPGAAGIVAGDFNGDKKIDLAVTSFGHVSFDSSGNITTGPSDGVRLLLGDGKGDFTFGAKFKVSGAHPTLITAGDLNKDGNLDLVTTDGGLGGLIGTNTVSVLLNYGDGHFAYPKVYATGGSPQGVTIADVNGDGLPDIITADEIGKDLTVLTQKSGGYYFNTPITLTGIDAPVDVIAIDVNGDKKIDLLTDGNADNTLDVLLGL